MILKQDLELVKLLPSGRKQNICSVVCHPDNNEAIFADLGGHWGLVAGISVSGDNTATIAGGVTSEDAEDMAALFNDDDEDDENSFSVAKVSLK